METTSQIIFIVGVIALALMTLGVKGIWQCRRIQSTYKKVQQTRSPLSDQKFCELAGLDRNAVLLVEEIRKALAEQGDYDPVLIYPEDEFHPTFGLSYDDTVAAMVKREEWIEGFDGVSFPLEDVNSVRDFINMILKLKNNSRALTAP
jgi:hypothetical protein